MPRKASKHTLDIWLRKTDYCKAVWVKMQGFKHHDDQAHICPNCPIVLCRCIWVVETGARRRWSGGPCP